MQFWMPGQLLAPDLSFALFSMPPPPTHNCTHRYRDRMPHPNFQGQLTVIKEAEFSAASAFASPEKGHLKGFRGTSELNYIRGISRDPSF